jgi:hypothetical protein
MAPEQRVGPKELCATFAKVVFRVGAPRIVRNSRSVESIIMNLPSTSAATPGDVRCDLGSADLDLLERRASLDRVIG